MHATQVNCNRCEVAKTPDPQTQTTQYVRESISNLRHFIVGKTFSKVVFMCKFNQRNTISNTNQYQQQKENIANAVCKKANE